MHAVPAADQMLHGAYRKDGRTVVLKLGLFRYQQQGHEVVSSDNKLLSGDEQDWRIVGKTRVDISGESRTAHVGPMGNKQGKGVKSNVVVLSLSDL